MNTTSKQLSLSGLLLGLCAFGAMSCQAADTVAGVVNSYELITELRPDSETGFTKNMRALHQACAATAKKLKVAVHPFPTFPPDFFVERTIHLRDGNSIYNKSTGNAIDHSAMTPANGCGTSTYQTVELSIQHNGLWRYFLNDEESQVPPELGEVRAPDAAMFAMYTLPKNVNGVALRCAAPGSVPDKRVEQACIVDPAVVIAAHPNGRPIDAHGSVRGMLEAHNTAMRLRPLSLKVGIKIAPSMFTR